MSGLVNCRVAMSVIFGEGSEGENSESEVENDEEEIEPLSDSDSDHETDWSLLKTTK